MTSASTFHPIVSKGLAMASQRAGGRRPTRKEMRISSRSACGK